MNSGNKLPNGREGALPTIGSLAYKAGLQQSQAMYQNDTQQPPVGNLQAVTNPSSNNSSNSFPDNQTFIECMSSMLKYMHRGFNEDPNLKGLLQPPIPIVSTAKPKKRRRKSRTLKLGEEEEEIIKKEERAEFQRVLESQFASCNVTEFKPLPECDGTAYSMNTENCSDMEKLMMVLLQYQSFKSYPFYTEDEEGQLEQIKLQKQRRHELMKQKRAIRRERRKEMKKKRGLTGSEKSKRTKSDSSPSTGTQMDEDSNGTNNSNLEDSLWSVNDYLSGDEEEGNTNSSVSNDSSSLLFSDNFLDGFDVNHMRSPQSSTNMQAQTCAICDLSPLVVNLNDLDFILTPGTAFLNTQTSPTQQQRPTVSSGNSTGFDSMFERQLLQQKNGP
jgi:hypothetical protein